MRFRSRARVGCATALLVVAEGCSLFSPLDFLGDGIVSPSSTSASSGTGGLGLGGAGGSGGGAGVGAGAAGGSGGSGAEGPVLELGYTMHLGRWLTSRQNDPYPYGFRMARRGVPFALGDKIAFNFSDADVTSTSGATQGSELVAYTTSMTPPEPLSLPKLEYYTRKVNGKDKFLPLGIPAVVSQGAISYGGLTIGSSTYFFIPATPNSQSIFTRTMLAHAQGESFGSLIVDYNLVAATRFIVNQALEEGDDVYVFGAGMYGQSGIYLAKVPRNQFSDRAAWTIFTGLAGGTPQYVAEESKASSLVSDTCISDFSVAKHAALGLYLLMYHCKDTIFLRGARAPWGPWGPALPVLDPDDEGGAYGRYIHAPPGELGFDDGLSDPGAVSIKGVPSSGFLVPQWFSELGPGLYSIVYLVSLGNPNTVSLMRTVLTAPDATASPPIRGEGLPKAALENGDFSDPTLRGWTVLGDDFTTITGPDGTPWYATTVDGVGSLSQSFVVDATTTRLEFSIRGGGSAEVRLLHGKDIVRRSRAANNPAASNVRWDISEFRGEELTVEIYDFDQSAPWGYVEVSGFTFE